MRDSGNDGRFQFKGIIHLDCTGSSELTIRVEDGCTLADHHQPTHSRKPASLARELISCCCCPTKQRWRRQVHSRTQMLNKRYLKNQFPSTTTYDWANVEHNALIETNDTTDRQWLSSGRQHTNWFTCTWPNWQQRTVVFAHSARTMPVHAVHRLWLWSVRIYN